MKPIKAKGTLSMKSTLENIFPSEYLQIMDEGCQIKFLRAFSVIMKSYSERSPDGYRMNKNDVRCFPKLKDLKKPFELCNLEDIKAVILAVEPYNNGEATGIPFQWKYDYRADFQLSDTQHDVDCIDYAVRTNQSTYTIEEVPIIKKDGTPGKRTKKVVKGELVHGIDWEFLASQGVLVIHASMTSEERQSNRHLKLWLSYTTAFLNCLYNHNPNFALMTIGQTFRNAYNPNLFNVRKDLKFMKSLKLIQTPNAYFDDESKETLTKFQPFTRLNNALKELGHAPIAFIQSNIKDE